MKNSKFSNFRWFSGFSLSQPTTLAYTVPQVWASRFFRPADRPKLKITKAKTSPAPERLFVACNNGIRGAFWRGALIVEWVFANASWILQFWFSTFLVFWPNLPGCLSMGRSSDPRSDSRISSPAVRPKPKITNPKPSPQRKPLFLLYYNRVLAHC